MDHGLSDHSVRLISGSLSKTVRVRKYDDNNNMFAETVGRSGIQNNGIVAWSTNLNIIKLIGTCEELRRFINVFYQ